VEDDHEVVGHWTIRTSGRFFVDFSPQRNFPRTETFSRRSYKKITLEPILRLLNLQLQRQRCSRPESFPKENKNNFIFKTHKATWRCKILQRWGCKSRS
jgi:hypothetical protein